jgi:hypothetical protein
MQPSLDIVKNWDEKSPFVCDTWYTRAIFSLKINVGAKIQVKQKEKAKNKTVGICHEKPQ